MKLFDRKKAAEKWEVPNKRYSSHAAGNRRIMRLTFGQFRDKTEIPSNRRTIRLFPYVVLSFPVGQQ